VNVADAGVAAARNTTISVVINIFFILFFSLFI
jgi:hypothetical protein